MSLAESQACPQAITDIRQARVRILRQGADVVGREQHRKMTQLCLPTWSGVNGGSQAASSAAKASAAPSSPKAPFVSASSLAANLCASNKAQRRLHQRRAHLSSDRVIATIKSRCFIKVHTTSEHEKMHKRKFAAVYHSAVWSPGSCSVSSAASMNGQLVGLHVEDRSAVIAILLPPCGAWQH